MVQGVIYAPVELLGFYANCIPDPEDLDGDDPCQGKTDQQDQQKEHFLFHSSKISIPEVITAYLT